MATQSKKNTLTVKESTFLWEGKSRDGKAMRGEMRAASEAVVQSTLRRQGISNAKVKKTALQVRWENS